MRKFVIGAALAMAFGGAAYAESFIVVRSTDPAVHRNTTFASGQTVPVAKGATVTVINGAGALSTLTSRSGSITLPGAANAGDAERISAMRSLLARPEARRTFGAMRGGAAQVGDCPAPETLTTIDAILKADADDCNEAARAAMTAYLANGAK